MVPARQKAEECEQEEDSYNDPEGAGFLCARYFQHEGEDQPGKRL
jgi:hypothetical protein